MPVVTTQCSLTMTPTEVERMQRELAAARSSLAGTITLRDKLIKELNTHAFDRAVAVSHLEAQISALKKKLDETSAWARNMELALSKTGGVHSVHKVWMRAEYLDKQVNKMKKRLATQESYNVSIANEMNRVRKREVEKATINEQSAKKQLRMLIEWIDDKVPLKIAVTAPGRAGDLGGWPC